MNTISMQPPLFEGWERHESVAEGTRSTWTNYLVVENEGIDMLVIGEPNSEAPRILASQAVAARMR